MKKINPGSVTFSIHALENFNPGLKCSIALQNFNPDLDNSLQKEAATPFSIKAPKECSKKFAAFLKANSLPEEMFLEYSFCS